MASAHNPEPEPDTGAKRAAEINQAMLSIPGYGDDTMFFVVRYVDKVKKSLREVEYEEFMTQVWKISKLADGQDQASSKSSGEASQESEMTPEERKQKLEEDKAKALAMVKGYPDLMRDFEPFIVKSRLMRKMKK